MVPQQPGFSSLFLEEQEWIPGYEAPFLVWVAGVAFIGGLALTTTYIIMRNK